MIVIIIHDYNQEMELGLETEGRNKLVSDFVTATFQVKIVIMVMLPWSWQNNDSFQHQNNGNNVSATK